MTTTTTTTTASVSTPSTINLKFKDRSNLTGRHQMRVSHRHIATAWLAGAPAKMGNGKTDGKTVFLHGNPIARLEGDVVSVSLAGWDTVTTRSWLNSLLRQAMPGTVRVGIHRARRGPGWTATVAAGCDGSGVAWQKLIGEDEAEDWHSFTRDGFLID